MKLLALNYFSFLTFLAGAIFLITGLFYKFKPPQTMAWYAPQLKAMRRSKETFQEGVRFAATPALVAGLFLLILSSLSNFFFRFDFLGLLAANIVIFSTCTVLDSLINHHINSIFDGEGNKINSNASI